MKAKIILLFLIILLASCKPIKYVTIPVKEVRTEYIHDSIFYTDTVERINNTYQRGDTIVVHDSVIVKKNSGSYHKEIVHDTVADTAAILALTMHIDEQQSAISDYQHKESELSERLERSDRIILISAILCALLALPWIVKIVKFFRNGS